VARHVAKRKARKKGKGEKLQELDRDIARGRFLVVGEQRRGKKNGGEET